VFAVVSATATFWVTLHADFLAHPGWLAVQKADFIAGPIGVGLYWMHRRPTNRFGLLLVVLGLLGVPYILESLSDPTLFALGVVAEDPMYLMITFVILAFPSGRLEGLTERLILAALAVIALVVLVVSVSTSHLAPGLSISQCRDACPGSGLGLSEWRAPDRVIATLPLVISLAMAGVVGWRFAVGTPPRRRALAIGTPIALLYLVVQATQQALFVVAPGGLAGSARWVQDVVQWTLAGSRACIWYGFLFALIAAELRAGRVMRRLVRASLAHPSMWELEGMLRGPLGDPGLRLGFWRSSTRGWVDVDGAPLEPPSAGQTLTAIARDGASLAIVHDTQLASDPELLQAAGAAALLAQENAELEAGWNTTLRELTESRVRLASAGERERRKLERDLHDGAQQRLVAAAINLTLADEALEEQEVHDRIARSRAELDQAMTELREIAHGIYPTALAQSGLNRAFDWLLSRYEATVIVTQADVGRFSPEIELAVYYCGLEAIQNASKHAGREARIWLRLYIEADRLHLEVRDDGPGFDVARVHDGVGLQNMRDRIGAIGGRVDVISEPGHGTLVAVSAPVRPGAGVRASTSAARPRFAPTHPESRVRTTSRLDPAG
jgi:signal transduction histidine kinase